jgi:molybdopterin molybdotransferase
MTEQPERPERKHPPHTSHGHGQGHGHGGAHEHPEVPGERLWTVDEHLADVLATVRPLPAQELPLLEAQDCLLLDDLVAPVDLPPFDNSSMDGYAVRTADLDGASEQYPSVLTVVGDIAAGAGRLPRVGPGQAARIMTGAPIPPGAEAVVPVEWTDGGSGAGVADRMAPLAPGERITGTELRVFRPVSRGAYVRTRGDDVAQGQTVLRAGARLGPAQLGLAAAVGHGVVRVRPRPRVAVLSTGSELVQPGTRPGPGQITDSNSFTLAAAARAAGAVAHRIGGVPDDAARLRALLEEQLPAADLVVTSGGVSVGAYDVVKEALEGGALGSVDFRRLRMQPGKPQGFGLLDGRVPLFALPGNPVSAYISFELFVRPAIRTMLGADPLHRPVVRARLSEGLPSPKGRRQFARARYVPPARGEEYGTAEPVGGSGSHLVAALAHADALVVVPEAVTELKAGELVETVLLGE